MNTFLLPARQWILLVLVLVATACDRREFIPATEIGMTPHLEAGELPIEYGEPYWFLDSLGHYFFSFPSKLIFLNGKVCNHHINPRTVERLENYLKANNLTHVKVRVNQYAPLDEWHRLTENTSMGWGWRYTFGVIGWLHYTLIPERLFAGFFFSSGDHYNPYTNTIHIFSDHESIAIHEGGHARDTAETTWKGTYSALRILPLVPLWQEFKATDDTFAWHRHITETRSVKKDYKMLYPAYCTYIGGEISNFTGLGYVIELPLVAFGHIIGRSHAAQEKAPDAGSP
ncbi:MAG: hypothetical protein AB7F75_03555 [Planctomycetota bacterium]